MATSASNRRSVPAGRLRVRAPVQPATVGPSGVAFAAMALGALAFGTALGLCTTAYVLDQRFDPAAVRSGSWVVWPRAGTAAIDPYARAIMAQTGEVPVVAAEGVLLIADRDQSGRSLSGECEYRVTGRLLPARLWSLSVTSPDGQPVAGPTGRLGFTSSGLLRDGDGGFTVRLSRSARAGNWLPVPESSFRLALHLYDAVLASGGAPEKPLPSVERIGCRS